MKENEITFAQMMQQSKEATDEIFMEIDSILTIINKTLDKAKTFGLEKEILLTIVQDSYELGLDDKPFNLENITQICANALIDWDL